MSLCVLVIASAWLSAAPIENLAPLARVSASSEFSADYTAGGAVDGVISAAGGHDDVGKAWAVRGDENRQTGWFRLEWDQPVTVSQIVYHGRTAWMLSECWRTYEVYADGAAKPCAVGELAMSAEPQLIEFGPTRVSTLTLRFTSSYGGLNPGASEIEAYAAGARLRPALAECERLRDRLAGRADAAPLVAELSALSERAAGLREGGAEAELVAQAEALRARLLDLVSPSPFANPAWDLDSLLFIKQHYRQPGHVYTAFMDSEMGTCSTQGPVLLPGGGIYRLSPVRPDGQATCVVDAGDGIIMDLDLSFDAREIVFSWKKPGQPYHLFRCSADGSGLTQLTDGPYHDFNPCWLPDGGIAFVSTRAKRFVLCNVTPVATLHRMERDSSGIRMLSANYVNDFTPAVMPDGRILYTRWEYVDRPAVPIQSLWTIQPDGTNLRVFYGNRTLDPATFIEGRPIPGSTRVLCTLAPHNYGIEGAIGIVDNGQAFDGEAGLANLTPELPVTLGNSMPGHTNRTPFPLSPDLYLVAHSEGQRYGIYACTTAGRRELVYRDADIDSFYPVPLRPRRVPPVLASSRSPDAGPGATLLLMDVYRGMEPPVARGTIAALRVVEEVPKEVRAAAPTGDDFSFQRVAVTRNGDDGLKNVLGTVPVEADGSAHLAVPADKAIYLQALDARGMEVRRMRSFLHMAEGERQVCIGCHEPRSTAPVNRLTTAAQRPASVPRPPAWGGGVFDFVRHAQPVLDAHCTSCHAGLDPAGRIDLSDDKTRFFNMAFDSLTLGGWVSTFNCNNGQEANILQIEPYAAGSHQSRLIKLIDDGHYGVALTPDERDRLVTWVDLNGPYYGTYELNWPDRYVGRDALPALGSIQQTLSERNCARCHSAGVGTDTQMNLTHPQWSAVLTSPLPREAGGLGLCGKGNYAGPEDPAYQSILSVLTAAAEALRADPRMDMPGARPAKLAESFE